MGCRILEDRETHQACFYCSTSEVAFGPLFDDGDEAERFLQWLEHDPRRYPVNDLIDKYVLFKGEVTS